jgi:geranylgeranyl pyrophosphate synthase
MALALTHDTLDIVRLLCEVTLRMIEGELYQLTKNGDADITEDEHFDIIRRKTAYLFGGCAEIGGMLGKVGPERETALREYGFNLGIAFQIIDDLLDVEGDPAQTGKATRLDARKTTFVSFSGVAGAHQLAAELCQTADRALAPFGRRADRLRELSAFVAARNI